MLHLDPKRLVLEEGSASPREVRHGLRSTLPVAARTPSASRGLPWLLLLMLASGTAHAQGDSGFLRGRGRTDVAISWHRDQQDEAFVGAEPTARARDAQRDTFSLYAAYGLTDDVDLVADVSYVVTDAEPQSGSAPGESALQDLSLAAKFRLARTRLGPGELTWLVAPGVKVPLGYDTDYSENPVNAPGHDQVDLRARVVAQYRLDAGPWAAVESGYDLRLGDPGDEIPFQLTLGFPVGRRLTLMPFYGHVFEGSSGEIDSGLATAGARFDRYGLAGYWSVNDSFGISANVRRTDGGRNESDGISLGVVLRF